MELKPPKERGPGCPFPLSSYVLCGEGESSEVAAGGSMRWDAPSQVLHDLLAFAMPNLVQLELTHIGVLFVMDRCASPCCVVPNPPPPGYTVVFHLPHFPNVGMQGIDPRSC